jgi:hypothetical protein
VKPFYQGVVGLAQLAKNQSRQRQGGSILPRGIKETQVTIQILSSVTSYDFIPRFHFGRLRRAWFRRAVAVTIEDVKNPIANLYYDLLTLDAL